MTTRIVSARSFFATMHTNKVTWLVGLEPNNYQNKVLYTWLKTVYDHSHQNKTTNDKWQKWRKDGRPSQTDVIFVVTDALVNVLIGEVLSLHCHENGDCHAVALRASSELSQSADCQSVRSRVWSELLQSPGDYQSERSRVVRPNSICTPANLPVNPRSVVGQEICIRHHKYLSTHKQEKPVPKLILKDSRRRHDGSSCDLKSDTSSHNGQCCRDSEPQKWTVVEFGFVTE